MGIQWHPQAVRSGSGWIVAWDDAYVGVADRRVNGDGLLGPISRFGSPTTVDQVGGDPPLLASDGDHALLTWSDAAGVHAQLLGSDGAPLGQGLILSSPANPALYMTTTYGGGRYFVTWRGKQGPDLYVATLDADGALVASVGTVSSLKTDIGEFDTATSGADGALVTWREGVGINSVRVRAARVAEDGSVLDPDGLVLGAQIEVLGSAATASGWLVETRAWPSPGAAEVLHIDAAGALVDSTPIIGGPTMATISAADWGATLAWVDGNTVLAQRIDPDGHALDTPPLTVASAVPPYTGASTSWDGTGSGITWARWDSYAAATVGSARIAADGSVQLGAGWVHDPFSDYADHHSEYSAGPANQLVAWCVPAEVPQETTSWNCYGTLLPGDGSTAITVLLTDGPAEEGAPTLSATDAGWLAAWPSSVTEPVGDVVYVEPLAAQGQPTQPPAAAFDPTVNMARPVACSNGSDHAVVWGSVARRFSAAGKLESATALPDSWGDFAASAGGDYLLSGTLLQGGVATPISWHVPTYPGLGLVLGVDALASDGERYLVSYGVGPFDLSGNVAPGRSGWSLLAADGSELASRDDVPLLASAAAWSGTSWIVFGYPVAEMPFLGFQAVRLDDTLAIAEPGVFTLDGTVGGVAAVGLPDGVVIAWESQDSDPYELFAARLDSDGHLMEGPLPLGQGAFPALAADPALGVRVAYDGPDQGASRVYTRSLLPPYDPTADAGSETPDAGPPEGSVPGAAPNAPELVPTGGCSCRQVRSSRSGESPALLLMLVVALAAVARLRTVRRRGTADR